MIWNFACPDWEERLRDGRPLVPELPLDAAAADRAVRVFDNLRLPDVVGTPRFREAAGDWFRSIVRAVFGSLDPVSGVRHVPDVTVLVPKKNSKSTGGGAIMLTALLLNKRPSALFGLFGPTQEVADIAFAAAAGMVACDTALARILHVRDHVKTIVHRGTGAELKITTFDPAVATGGKYAGWLLDEAHLLAKVAYASRVLGQLRGARVAIAESFGIIITTQSEDPPAGVFLEELTLARNVRDGLVTDVPLLPVLYEFPERVQQDETKPWLDPALWPQVLPNLGRSVSIDTLTTLLAAARAKGEADMRRWASQHLNIQIGLALRSDSWAGAEAWEKAAEPGLDLDAILARSEVISVGVDGGGDDDLFGLAVLGRCRDTGDWLAWTHAWARPKVLARRKEIAPLLKDFARAGDLTLAPLAGPDVMEAARLIMRVADAGLLSKVGIDPIGSGDIVEALQSLGLTKDALSGVTQGYKLNGAIITTERRLDGNDRAPDGTPFEGARGLKHGGSPLMAWCVSNAKVELKGNAVLVTKAASGKGKIDPLMALFNAVAVMMEHPQAMIGRSFWDKAQDAKLLDALPLRAA